MLLTESLALSGTRSVSLNNVTFPRVKKRPLVIDKSGSCSYVKQQFFEIENLLKVMKVTGKCWLNVAKFCSENRFYI